jgi:DNA-binding GntR family transcriptional regulator
MNEHICRVLGLFVQQMPKESAAARKRHMTTRPKRKRPRIALAPCPPPRVIARSSLHELLASQLRAMMQSGELPPGLPIVEARFCQQFGVSRTPIREALKVLAVEGLVELRPHRTPIVARVDRQEIAAIFEVIVPLERLAAERACANMSADDLANLEALHREMVAHHRVGDRAAYGAVNRRIHLAIVSCAKNSVLTVTYGGFSNRLARARATTNFDNQRWGESINEHEQIMTALRRRDPQAAGEVLAEHTRRTGNAVLKNLQTVEEIGREDVPVS